MAPQCLSWPAPLLCSRRRHCMLRSSSPTSHNKLSLLDACWWREGNDLYNIYLEQHALFHALGDAPLLWRALSAARIHASDSHRLCHARPLAPVWALWGRRPACPDLGTSVTWFCVSLLDELGDSLLWGWWATCPHLYHPACGLFGCTGSEADSIGLSPFILHISRRWLEACWGCRVLGRSLGWRRCRGALPWPELGGAGSEATECVGRQEKCNPAVELWKRFMEALAPIEGRWDAVFYGRVPYAAHITAVQPSFGSEQLALQEVVP